MSASATSAASSSSSSTPSSSVPEILLIGGTSSGKTLLLRQIRFVCQTNNEIQRIQNHKQSQADKEAGKKKNTKTSSAAANGTAAPSTGGAQADLFIDDTHDSHHSDNPNVYTAPSAPGPSSSSSSSASSAFPSSARQVNFSTRSTTGVERYELVYCDKQFIAKEVGGPMKSTWSSYYASAKVVLYVLDRSFPPSLSSAFLDLLNLLSCPSSNSAALNSSSSLPPSIPLVLVLNKSDCDTALSRADLENIIQLDEIIQFAKEQDNGIKDEKKKEEKRDDNNKLSSTVGASSVNRSIAVFETSAKDGRGVQEMLDYIVSKL